VTISFHALWMLCALGAVVHAVLMAAAVWLARWRPAFVPDVLRDEALLAVSVLGASVAGFDVTMWLNSGTVLDAPEARRRSLPALLRTLAADVEQARQEHRSTPEGGSISCSKAKSAFATASTPHACWSRSGGRTPAR
jgi:hypothetical protein